jgi:excisionase family DNA binding protein
MTRGRERPWIADGPSTVDTSALLSQLAEHGFVTFVPRPRVEPADDRLQLKRWYTVREVAEMLGYSLSKVKMLVAMREIRSLKDGKSRRILPEWVDEYVASRVERSA